METAGINTVAETRTQTVCAVSAQFSSRGLAKAVQKDAEEQILREQQTRAMEPLAYRMSSLTDAAIAGAYRKGKDVMSGADLIAYIRETRRIRTKDADFSVAPVADEPVRAGEAEKSMVAPVRGGEGALTVGERIAHLPQKLKALPAQTAEKLRDGMPVWFNTAKRDVSKEQKRFPLSAFAALAAVAVSLMLIVASSVMVHHGERAVNELTLQLSQMSGEVNELRSDLDVQNDLLAIREIAVNEFGMVEEEYVRLNYITQDKTDTIEAFEEKEETGVGLSALLSALGIK